MPPQHIVIVGGSSGIGLASARRLLSDGYTVTITGRDGDRLELARKELGPNVKAIVMDAADPARLPAAFARIGHFDHLVLALGSRKGMAPFAIVGLDEVRQGFEEKVFAHFATAQAALPSLRKDGSMTFVAGLSAHGAAPGTAGIGAANAAVVALIPILASELKPLRVNCVSPGVIATPWWDFMSEDQRHSLFAEFARKTPVERIGEADDIAQVIAMLVTNTFMTGETIICDGGLRLAS